MDQSQRYPFMFPPPRSLTERLKAEANGHAPAAEDLTPSIMALGNGDGTGEPAPSAVTCGNGSSDAPAPPLKARRNGHDDATPSLMARRFAPDGIPEDRHVQVEAPLAPAVQTRALAPWGMHVLIVVLVLVALVPSTTLGAMVWLGMLPAPWMRGAPHDGAPSAIEQASVTATLAPATTLPKQAMEVPAVELSAPDSVAAQAGQEVPFAITLDGTDALPARSIIAVSGLPVGASFSEGRPYGETEWTFRPDEIGDLKLLLPSSARGQATLKVQLAAADGRMIASAETTLKVAPDPKAALVLRSEEATLTADLIAHGNKMVGVGYFPGARAYFGRAAEAGSGEAALAMGETYDPELHRKDGRARHQAGAGPGDRLVRAGEGAGCDRCRGQDRRAQTGGKGSRTRQRSTAAADHRRCAGGNGHCGTGGRRGAGWRGGGAGGAQGIRQCAGKPLIECGHGACDG